MLLKKLLIICSLIIYSGIAIASNQNQPSIIFVHGALFTKNSWIEVQQYLEKQGVSSIAINLPGRANDHIPPNRVTLTSAVTKLCNAINKQKKSVILVGHSQGGAFITQAVSECGSKIKGLVYIAALIPSNGETVFKDLSNQDNANFYKCAIFDKENFVFRVNKDGPIKAMFMADVGTAEATKAIRGMVSEPLNIGQGKLSYDPDRFNSIPKFYIETLNDKIISINTQKVIENKAKFKKIYTMNTSHSPFLSQPELLSDYLVEIKNTLYNF